MTHSPSDLPDYIIDPSEEIAVIATDARPDNEIKADVKGWFERWLNWLIGGGCLVVGIIIGHVWR